jgi:hypothetical protein
MAQVTFSYTPQHAPACYPSDVNGLLALVAGGAVQGTIPDNAGGGIVVQPSPPASNLANKVWLKTDGAGRPLGWYVFYQGVWRKVYTGVTIGEIRMIVYYGGLFDGNGRGVIGGDMDGWQICNGNNGAPNLQGFFPVPGVQGEVIGKPAGSWYTDADGVAWRTSGGQKGQQVVNGYNLPNLFVTSRFTLTAAFGNQQAAVGNFNDNPKSNWPVCDPDTQQPLTGERRPLPFPHLYVALGFVMFIGY